ncbi:LOG family protein [Rodentibacter genomosp. 2]|uniref:Cytokinin riboside 5'-monophosphate phosphoribohydrolase n=1 Tax=Rodentibacter genomosp. 2 TaxID=1908266 RepID=A0A1V3JJU3_9PAST|nr:TIGR00730 family Rossman fold protein [Rodentibacter genomosp. 2]OOF57070.1 Rossman fold protein, TIGR00730 family [Rodentibacter genomosp. 2]
MNITVYCGASLGNDPVYQASAVSLGKWIAANRHTLIYGGGRAGLMGVIADTVLAEGGKVIGVIPTFLQARELAHGGLTQLITVETMQARKKKMIELGDAYIALAGGPGTLEEISEVISWARIGQNPNPCILFNQSGYYNSLKMLFEQMVKSAFLTTEDYQKILFSDDLEEIAHFIVTYQAPEIRRY